MNKAQKLLKILEQEETKIVVTAGKGMLQSDEVEGFLDGSADVLEVNPAKGVIVVNTSAVEKVIKKLGSFGVTAKVSESLSEAVSLTYGTLPDRKVFDQQFSKFVKGDYDWNLKGADARAADAAGLDSHGSFDVDDLWFALESLVKEFKNGNEQAGDLASGLLMGIGIEWV